MIGRKLAHYEITDLLGKGGMGEVYRARDPRLRREVAIKILPGGMSDDPERVARFHREALSLARLQHPNVASIHDFVDLPEARFLVMELVEGEDLASRVGRGPIPVGDAVDIARQIALGLEAAHDQGIVHRDLKPANVKITPQGTVKILDFGLARAQAGDRAAREEGPDAPTVTAGLTRIGTVLGTAAYMSPEQAQGKPVDARTDLWAWAAILFEMLTGRRLFGGESVNDALAAVLTAEPDWSVLPAATPATVRHVLQKCLVRDPRLRMRSAGDVWLDLEYTDSAPEDSGNRTARFSPRLQATLLFLAASILLGAWWLRPTPPTTEIQRPRHLSIALPESAQFVSRDQLPLGAPQPCVDISRDGQLVVCVVEYRGRTWLYRHHLSDPRGEIVAGTEGAYHPRISPDGEHIAFMAEGQVKRVGAHGDRITPITAATNSFGQSWLNDDELLVTRSEARELLRIDVGRGSVDPVPETSAGDLFYWPESVPGLDAVLVNRSHVSKPDVTEPDPIFIHGLDRPIARRVGMDGTMPRLMRPDLLLAIRDGALVAANFDASAPERVMRPRSVMENVVVESVIGQFAVSEEGTLVYVPGTWMAGKTLVLHDATGDARELPFPAAGYGDFRLSPDGKRLGITIGTSDSKIWVFDLVQGTRRVLTTEEGRAVSATWSPDGTRIAYTLQESGGECSIRVRTVGRASDPVVLHTDDQGMSPCSWPEAGRLVYDTWRQGDIFQLDPASPGRIQTLVSSSANEWGPDVSPDGSWMAYTSDESGRYEIHVRYLGPDGRSWPVSIDGGEEPVWASDGSAIFFRNGTKFLRAPVLEAGENGPRFRTGTPEVYVEGTYANVPGLSYDVTPDGQRLLLLRVEGGTERAGHLNVVLNFDALVAERMAQE